MYKKDYYKILGLNKDATEEEMKKAYRRLALLYHPDRNHGNKEAEEKFKEIGEAYAVLSDRERRREYDLSGYTRFRRKFAMEDIFEGFDLEDILRNFNQRFEADVSGSFFCGRGERGCGKRKSRSFSRRSVEGYSSDFRGIDLIHDLHLSSAEALYGTEREIFLKKEWETERMTIKIPPGVEDGTVLQVSREGKDTYRGVGDNLYLRIKVAED